MSEEYYDFVTVTAKVEFKVGYRKGKKECLERVLGTIERELPSNLLGTGPHGGYTVKRGRATIIDRGLPPEEVKTAASGPQSSP